MSIDKLLAEAIKSGLSALNEAESKQVLKTYGIPVINETVTSNTDEAVKAAEDTGYPVVLKGLGSTLLHKTDQGLVHLNLGDAGAVRKASAIIKANAGKELEGLLVQPFLKGNRELVVGMFRDDLFGPVVMFGVGGVLTEAFHDVTFRLAPLTEADASEMLDEIKAKSLLGQFRGEKASDRSQLINILIALSDISINHPEISEIDINPLLLEQEGNVFAVDALVVLSQENQKTPAGTSYLPVDPVAIASMLNPKSIAFIGASAKMGKWGHTLTINTISGGYKGDTYMVNPGGGTIAGRKAYKSLDEIPDEVDLAIVTIPASKVIDLIPQLEKKRIKNMLLITSGFGETGSEGKKLAQALVEKARKAGIYIIGPNTMGIWNTYINLFCTASASRSEPGSTAVVSQSGNMGVQLLGFAERQGIGIRGFIGSGNEAMITIEDYLDAFEADSLTKTLMLYVESVKNGRRFFESARRLGKLKPVVLLKGGRTQAGNRAAASHTGALSSDLRIFNAMCRQAGIVKVEQPMDMLDLAASFSSLPLPKGNRAAIMTLGGGWGVITADLCSEYGLNVPELSSELCNHIDKLLPPFWSRSNPVDLVGEHEPSLPITIMEELLKWDGCDGVIDLGILGTRFVAHRFIDYVKKTDPNYSNELLDTMNDEIIKFENIHIEQMAKLMDKYNKPIFGVSITTDATSKTVNPIPGSPYKSIIYQTPEKAVKAFAKMSEYNQFLNR